MSFTFRVRNTRSGNVVITSGGTLELPTMDLCFVPELSTAVIAHGLVITEMDSPVLLVRKPGLMMDKGLLVDGGPVELGEVCTAVFNIWPSRLRLKKGEVVSYLLCL